ncbi:MAG: hypothetical protein Q9161_001345 [Pseudevernia consocians]
MRPQPFLATTLSLFTAFASASISGIAVPSTIAPGSSFRVTIITEDFIQSVQDVAIAFGLAPNAAIANSSLGTLLSSKYLGPDDSNIETNITHIVSIPDGLATGPIVFTSSLFSLLGADFEPNLQSFSVDVTVGDATSSDLVGSTPA